MAAYDTTEPAAPSRHDAASDTQTEKPSPGGTARSSSDRDVAAGDASLSRTETSKSIAETLSLPHEIIFVGLVCMAQLCTQCGLGQTLFILDFISSSFGITNPAIESWLIAGYSLSVGTFIILSGRLGDVFGYKRMLLIGYVWFAVWSMVAGLAVYSNHVLFVFARVLSGIGPAICLPNGVAILGVTYPPGRRKTLAFSLFGGCAPSGAVLGGAFAGIFAELAWWPWTYWSFAITLAVTAVAGYFFIPEPPARMTPSDSLSAKVRSLDLPAATVAIVALVLFNYAWNQAPISGWDDSSVIATLVLGVALFAVFIVVELRYSSNPLVPFSALNREVGFVLAAVACGWGCFGIWIYYFVQTLQHLQGNSALLAVAKMAPVTVSGLTASLMVTLLLPLLGPAMIMTLSLVAFTAGAIITSTLPIHQTYWAQAFVTTLIMPFGMDMSFPGSTLLLSNSVPREHQGIAASLVTTVVNYSISIALGVAGTVEVHVNNGGKTAADVQKGYRSALYVAIGLAALGVVVCLHFLYETHRTKRKEADAEKRDDGRPSSG